ncbi:hypothetical protein BOTBODRAFT_433015 [Botryobasidium botryosum FD-172 SS1]|uniref:Uncharacterized protein n=1 Tax=Botryobasidium botryosum (strain FD-172 SS1) TaxID=930990 RepID=A0A067N505_BOTB1|nr:hypothetical protein BOTBODRAFT_433015 [Botryobasidium botryosum FD-172 SS1]
MEANPIAAIETPIYRLPNEIILDILIDIYGPATISSGDGSTKERIALNLSQTCRSWRNLIHNCSHFWVPISMPCQESEALDIAAQRFEYAGQRPLSINIYSIPDSTAPHSRRAIRLLQESVERWAWISIGTSLQFVDVLLQECDGFAATLQSFVIHPPIPTNHDNEIPLSLALNIPNTRLVSSRNGLHVELHYCIPSFTPSFGRAITHLSVEIPEGDSIYNIIDTLRSCPNLVDLSFTHYAPLKPIHFIKSIPLLRLTNLYIDICRADILPFFQLAILETFRFFSAEWSDLVVASVLKIMDQCRGLSTFRGGVTFYPRDLRLQPHPIQPSDNDAAISTAPIPSIVSSSIKEFELFQHTPTPAVRAFLLRLALPQAVSLSLTNIPLDAVHHLISGADQLEVVSLRSIHGISPCHPRFSLSALEALILANSLHVLSHLHVPNLEQLVLIGLGNEVSTGLLTELVSSSSPPLVKLVMRGIPVLDGDFVQALRGIPTLRNMSVRRCFGISDSSFYALATPSEDGQYILPALEKIDFAGCAITPGGALALLQSRNKMPPTGGAGGGAVPPCIKGHVEFGGVPSDTDRAALEVRHCNLFFPGQHDIEELRSILRLMGPSKIESLSLTPSGVATPFSMMQLICSYIEEVCRSSTIAGWEVQNFALRGPQDLATCFPTQFLHNRDKNLPDGSPASHLRAGILRNASTCDVRSPSRKLRLCKGNHPNRRDFLTICPYILSK